MHHPIIQKNYLKNYRYILKKIKTYKIYYYEHVEEFESIKLEIQTVKFDADKALLVKIREMIRYLNRFSSNRILTACLYKLRKYIKNSINFFCLYF